MSPSRFGRSLRPRTRIDSGFSLIELLIVVAIILIIAGIAIPNLLRSKISADQAAAVAGLRTLATASVAYSTLYNNGYPPTLASLGGPTSASGDCNQSGLLDSTLASPPHEKNGYLFAYAGAGGTEPNTPAGCTPGFQAYLATAVPISVGVSGENAYCSDEPAATHFDPTGNAPSSVADCEALTVVQ